MNSRHLTLDGALQKGEARPRGEVARIRYVLIALIAALSAASPANAQEELAAAFRSVCIETFPIFACVEAKFSALGAWEDEQPPYQPFTPHFSALSEKRWQMGNRQVKTLDDLLIRVAFGTVTDAPASGCQVEGHGDFETLTPNDFELTSAQPLDAWQRSFTTFGAVGVETKGAAWIVQVRDTRALPTLAVQPPSWSSGPGRTSLSLITFDATIIDRVRAAR